MQRLNAGLQPSDAAKARLTLTTTHWHLGQGNFAYFVQLQACAAGNQRVVAKSKCKYLRKVGEIGTSGQQLLEGSAAGLKSAYALASEHGADYFFGGLIPDDLSAPALPAMTGKNRGLKYCLVNRTQSGTQINVPGSPPARV